jgi:hypothetical protein
MQNMVGGPGCSVDGTASGANPLGRVVDQFLTMGPGGAQGRMVGGPNQGAPAQLRNNMNQGFNGAQRGPQMKQMSTGGGGGPQMEEIWMAQQRGGVRGPPPMMQQMRGGGQGAEWAAQAAQSNRQVGMEAAFTSAAQSGQSRAPRMAPRIPMMRGPMMVSTPPPL